jgi:hypothetical protein
MSAFRTSSKIEAISIQLCHRTGRLDIRSRFVNALQRFRMSRARAIRFLSALCLVRFHAAAGWLRSFCEYRSPP